MRDLTMDRRAHVLGVVTLAACFYGACGDGADAADSVAPHAAEVQTGSASEQAAGPATSSEAAFAWPADCQEKYKFVANDKGGPNQVAVNYEGYRDFYFDLPWKGTEVQAVAIRPAVDNKKVVHHMTLLDDRSAHIAHWGPGAEARNLPPDVGMFMPTKGRFKLEIHYYNVRSGAVVEPDQTGFELCITRKFRTHTSTMFPFVAPSAAPAGRVTTNTATCTVSAASKVSVIANGPHMHKLGAHAKLEVLRANGTVEVLHDRPFSIDLQQDYPLDVSLESGDKVRTTCVYDNRTKRDVNFGPNTDDEMCFNFVTYYPRCALHCVTGNPVIDLLTTLQEGECAGKGPVEHAHPDAAPTR